MLVTRVSGLKPGPAPFYPARPLSQEAFLYTEDHNQGSEGLTMSEGEASGEGVERFQSIIILVTAAR